MYDRGEATAPRYVNEWDRGFGWLAHPAEEGRRVSHAVVGDGDDIWLIDPLDAPDVDERIAALGERDVAGVAVCTRYHTRDADRFAARYDAPVYVPSWLDDVAADLGAPVERYDGRLGDSGFVARAVSPLPGFREAALYRESDRTLYVPDVLVSHDADLEVYLFCRPVPPREPFADLDPERILLGHGTGVFDDASGALDAALSTARRGFPRALRRDGWWQLRAALAALR